MISKSILAAAFMFASFGGADAAQAHAKLMVSTPAGNASVAKPTKVTMTFNEKVMPSFSGAEILMTAMLGMANHKAMKLSGLKPAWSTNGKTLTLTAGRPFPVGTYRVSWYAAGADTHRMKGGFAFSVR